MNITYVSACMDSSGYAEAARNHIAALHQAGVKVRVAPVTFEKQKSELGRLGILMKDLVEKGPEGKIQILHLTPQNFPALIVKDKYNIGYVAWETDTLPDMWVKYINQLDEVWVPCDHNVSVFKSSGVTIPVFVMPHPFDVDNPEVVTSADSVIANRNENDFVFYSIFQWTERKNPLGLLKAFLTEFSSEEKVCLVLKTYLVNPSANAETEKLRHAISEIKAKLYLKDYPKILLVSSLLSRAQIQSLHMAGDCYVSLHRCEGFGIPLVEAMLASKPVIATSYGGPDMFLKAPSVIDPNQIQTGYPVGYSMTPCYGMPWDVYTGQMLWADPDLVEAKKLMRKVFTDRQEAIQVGQAGKTFIHQNYSWSAVGQKMKARLEQIEEEFING